MGFNTTKILDVRKGHDYGDGKKKIIQFKNIVKDFDGQIVLKGIDLDIYEK